jgi:hypothetical protein
MLCQLSYGHQVQARFYQEKEPGKTRGSEVAMAAKGTGGGYSPQPRNSVCLSSFLPSSTILKTLEGMGLFIMAMLPLES